MKALVCDCSISAAWCLPDEANEVADGILRRLGETELRVPAIWTAEMANVLWAAERRGRITGADAEAALAAIARLPLRVDTPGPPPGRLLAAARANELSAYDAAYLELALRERLPLATLDGSLAEAARSAGVQLLVDGS